MQPETRFKMKVVKDLKTLPNCFFVKVQQVVKRGTPDFLLCVAGCFVGLELKSSERERPSPLQEFNLEAIALAGGMVFVACPENWKNTFEVLQHLSIDTEPFRKIKNAN